MPQMNPMPWVMLFALFILIFLLTNSINYFYPNNMYVKSLKTSNMNKIINWKW